MNTPNKIKKKNKYIIYNKKKKKKKKNNIKKKKKKKIKKNDRPDLHWRDLQYLVMETATPIDHGDSDWKYLPSGRLYNHKYGYGKLDAYKIVERAKTWELVNEATSFTTDKQFENDIIDILESKIYVSEKSVRNFRNVEQITVTVDIEHQCRGEIQVELISPNNVVSLLATRRVNDCSSEGLRNWTFMTVKHW